MFGPGDRVFDLETQEADCIRFLAFVLPMHQLEMIAFGVQDTSAWRAM